MLECLAMSPASASIEANTTIAAYLLSMLPSLSTPVSPAGTEPMLQAAASLVALIDIYYSDEGAPWDGNFRTGGYSERLAESVEGVKKTVRAFDRWKEGGREGGEGRRCGIIWWCLWSIGEGWSIVRSACGGCGPFWRVAFLPAPQILIISAHHALFNFCVPDLQRSPPGPSSGISRRSRRVESILEGVSPERGPCALERHGDCDGQHHCPLAPEYLAGISER
jgi:hypothetical protein